MLPMLPRLARRAAAGLAAAAALAAGPAAAEPALWAIQDEDSTIYLFGTVHFLKPDTQWRSEKVRKALAESEELVLEVIGVDDPAKVQPLLAALGIDRAKPLSAKLDPEDRPKLEAAAKVVGLPAPSLEPMRPWLAAMTLMVAPVVKAGYDPKSGVETVLTAEAKAAGKPLDALETVEQQLRFFADMPEATQVDLLEATLDDFDQAEAILDGMVTAWAAGDVKGLEDAFVEETKRDYPALYEIAVVNRNRAWADELKQRLAGKGVSFVAVGAGHLVGPDSVQVELAKRGIKAERR